MFVLQFFIFVSVLLCTFMYFHIYAHMLNFVFFLPLLTVAATICTCYYISTLPISIKSWIKVVQVPIPNLITPRLTCILTPHSISIHEKGQSLIYYELWCANIMHKTHQHFNLCDISNPHHILIYIIRNYREKKKLLKRKKSIL